LGVVANRKSILLVVFLTVFVDLLGFGIVIPLLPLYADSYHPTRIQFDLLVCTYSAMQFLAAPFLGRLSDRFGRRPVLIVSLIGTVIGYLVFAFARSIEGLFLARLIDGITGGNISTAHAVIADVTGPEDRAKGMGMVGMAFGLGFIFGPAIGGFAVRLGPAAPGLVAATFSLTALLWAVFRLPETRPEGLTPRRIRLIDPGSLGRSLTKKDVGVVLIVGLVTFTAFAAFEATFSQFVKARTGASLSTISWLFVAVGATSAFTQGFLIRKLAPAVGEKRLVVVGTALIGIGLLTLPFVQGFVGIGVTIALLAVGTGITNPSLSSLVSKRTGRESQGEALGAYQSMASLGRIGGPFTGEDLYQRLGARGPFLFGAALEGVAAVLSLLALRGEDTGV